MRGSVEKKFGVVELRKQHIKELYPREIKKGASL